MQKLLYKMFCLLLGLFFLSSLSSCSTIDSLLRYILSLPMTILDSLPTL